jgi:hypothetical protein
VSINTPIGEPIEFFQAEKVIEPFEYSTFSFTLNTGDLIEGAYTATLRVTAENTTLQAQDDFTVGLLAGEVLGLTVEDVPVGSPAVIELTIRNMGNLPLNVTISLAIMDLKGQKLSDFNKTGTVKVRGNETYMFTWIPQIEGHYLAKAKVWYGHDYAEVQEAFKAYAPSAFPPQTLLIMVLATIIGAIAAAMYVVKAKIRGRL